VFESRFQRRRSSRRTLLRQIPAPISRNPFPRQHHVLRRRGLFRQWDLHFRDMDVVVVFDLVHRKRCHRQNKIFPKKSKSLVFIPLFGSRSQGAGARVSRGILLVFWGSANAAYIRLTTGGGRMTRSPNYWIIGGDSSGDAHGPFLPR
jgi:hypothetical protein